MKFLLDTNVVSALRVPSRHPEVEAWTQKVSVSDQYVSAISISEIERGVHAMMRRDMQQGEILNRWFETQVLPSFEGRILAFDLAAARVLGRYKVPEHAPLDDALIAAIAEANQMTVCTRNIRHFEPLGVSVVNLHDHLRQGRK